MTPEEISELRAAAGLISRYGGKDPTKCSHLSTSFHSTARQRVLKQIFAAEGPEAEALEEVLLTIHRAVAAHVPHSKIELIDWLILLYCDELGTGIKGYMKKHADGAHDYSHRACMRVVRGGGVSVMRFALVGFESDYIDVSIPSAHMFLSAADILKRAESTMTHEVTPVEDDTYTLVVDFIVTPPTPPPPQATEAAAEQM
jgi:hypothetical protein